MREWAVLASKGRLLLSDSVILASLKAAVQRSAKGVGAFVTHYQDKAKQKILSTWVEPLSLALYVY